MDNCSDKLSLIQRRGLPQLKINVNFCFIEKKVENKNQSKVKKKPRLN